MNNNPSDATWNRLTHTDSGHCSNGDMSTGSTQTQSLPSLYQHCSLSTSTPLKTLSRENVLLSPTLPHSLSDHIGKRVKGCPMRTYHLFVFVYDYSVFD